MRTVKAMVPGSFFFSLNKGILLAADWKGRYWGKLSKEVGRKGRAHQAVLNTGIAYRRPSAGLVMEGTQLLHLTPRKAKNTANLPSVKNYLPGPWW